MKLLDVDLGDSIRQFDICAFQNHHKNNECGTFAFVYKTFLIVLYFLRLGF